MRGGQILQEWNFDFREDFLDVIGAARGLGIGAFKSAQCIDQARWEGGADSGAGAYLLGLGIGHLGEGFAAIAGAQSKRHRATLNIEQAALGADFRNILRDSNRLDGGACDVFERLGRGIADAKDIQRLATDRIADGRGGGIGQRLAADDLPRGGVHHRIGGAVEIVGDGIIVRLVGAITAPHLAITVIRPTAARHLAVKTDRGGAVVGDRIHMGDVEIRADTADIEAGDTQSRRRGEEGFDGLRQIGIVPQDGKVGRAELEGGQAVVLNMILRRHDLDIGGQTFTDVIGRVGINLRAVLRRLQGQQQVRVVAVAPRHLGRAAQRAVVEGNGLTVLVEGGARQRRVGDQPAQGRDRGIGLRGDQQPGIGRGNGQVLVEGRIGDRRHRLARPGSALGRGDAVALVIQNTTHNMQAVIQEAHAAGDRNLVIEIVAILRNAGLGAGFHALELVVENEVDHARDRIGTIGGGGAAGDDVHPLNQRFRNLRRIYAARAAGGDHAAAIDQHQSP